MADLPYCTTDDVIAVAGQMAVDLRTDDVPDLEAHLAAAIEYASSSFVGRCIVERSLVALRHPG